MQNSKYTLEGRLVSIKPYMGDSMLADTNTGQHLFAGPAEAVLQLYEMINDNMEQIPSNIDAILPSLEYYKASPDSDGFQHGRLVSGYIHPGSTLGSLLDTKTGELLFFGTYELIMQMYNIVNNTMDEIPEDLQAVKQMAVEKLKHQVPEMVLVTKRPLI